jgi:ADP-heptose:LPS heptosyltransferase
MHHPFHVQEIWSRHDRRWSVLFQDDRPLPEEVVSYFKSFQRIYLFSRQRPKPSREHLSWMGQEALTWIPSFPDEQERIPLTVLQRKVLQNIGIPWIEGAPRLSLSRKEEEESSKILEHQGLAGKGRASLLGIHPGSGSLKKNWPLAGFLAMAGEVANREWATPFFILGPVEMERNPDWADQIRGRGFPLLTDITLSILAGVLKQCRYYLGNDSGVSHLAAALGVTTLVLFGPTDPALWAPRGPKMAVISGKKNTAYPEKTRGKSDTSCFNCLSLDDVLRQAESIIGQCKGVE